MCLAIPGKIVSCWPRIASLAVVDVLGVRRKVDLGLLQDDPPVTGDWVLIHVGFAMSKISEADALDQIAHAHGTRRERSGDGRGSGLRPGRIGGAGPGRPERRE